MLEALPKIDLEANSLPLKEGLWVSVANMGLPHKITHPTQSLALFRNTGALTKLEGFL